MNKIVEEDIKRLIKELRKKNCTIKEFPHKINWDTLAHYHKLSKDFMREFKDKIDWSDVARYQKLDENFIREFIYYFDIWEPMGSWMFLSLYQTLSEDFIRTFKNSVDWTYIFESQTLSEDFKIELKPHISRWFLNFTRISNPVERSQYFLKTFKMRLEE